MKYCAIAADGTNYLLRAYAHRKERESSRIKKRHVLYEGYMAYNELIKSFGRIRDYMRDFHVYGFKSRNDFNAKSARSYDNERRRIESWLAEYMSFRQDANGKNIFMSVDSRAITHNPLYNAFKAKTFTNNDINLHFFLLDMLSDGQPLPVQKIIERIEAEYLSFFETSNALDESTLRKKLKEYEEIGLVYSRKQGKQVFYCRAEDTVDLDRWKDAVSFFSQTDPIGVVGSYILDKFDDRPDYFCFKHHYILYALESEVMFTALSAIRQKATIEIEICNRRRGKVTAQLITPIQIFISVQNGRSYLVSYHLRFKKVMLFRLDTITKISLKEPDPSYDQNAGFVEKYRHYLWGVSAGVDFSLDHLEMTIRIQDGEEYIINRLEREKRCGRLEQIDEYTYTLIVDVYDAAEMLPWLRTFIGRIIALTCSNPRVIERFMADLQEMEKMYGVI